MPMPKPNMGEKQDDFMDRCMGMDMMKEEFPNNKERVAVCVSMWKDRSSPQDGVERRYLPADECRLVKPDGEHKSLEGYAAVFNKATEIMGFREIVKPGAFALSLKTADVRALVNHDGNMILGRSKAGTLRLAEDENGLKVSIDPPDTTTGRDIMESVKRGDIDGMSFAFRTIKDSWHKEDGQDVRELEEVELHDVSVVTYPAYADTSIAVRSRDSWQKANEAAQGPQNINAQAHVCLAEI